MSWTSILTLKVVVNQAWVLSCYTTNNILVSGEAAQTEQAGENSWRNWEGQQRYLPFADVVVMAPVHMAWVNDVLHQAVPTCR